MTPGRTPTPHTHGGHVAVHSIAELLAPAVGDVQSVELVMRAVRENLLDPERMTLAQAFHILESMGAAPGVVGIAARSAAARLQGRKQRGSDAQRAPPDVVSRPERSRQPRRTVSRAVTRGLDCPLVAVSEIVELLAHSLGSAKSQQIIATALETRGIEGDQIAFHSAIEVLDWLARAQGIVGIASRFAKTHLLLRLQGD